MRDFTKAIVFDMDGTIADFYGVEGWLEDLQARRVRPYAQAKPLYNMEELNEILSFLQAQGWKIVITSWLAKDSCKSYDERVRTAKRNWLKKHNFPYDEIHLVQYGTTKANCTRKKYNYQILIDDNEQVRNGWSLGRTINANENIIPELLALIEQEYY